MMRIEENNSYGRNINCSNFSKKELIVRALSFKHC